MRIRRDDSCGGDTWVSEGDEPMPPAPFELARDYVQGLVPGDEIIDDTDADTIEPFRSHIPAALAARGWCLEPIPGGWRVVGSRDRNADAARVRGFDPSLKCWAGVHPAVES